MKEMAKRLEGDPFRAMAAFIISKDQEHGEKFAIDALAPMIAMDADIIGTALNVSKEDVKRVCDKHAIEIYREIKALAKINGLGGNN